MPSSPPQILSTASPSDTSATCEAHNLEATELTSLHSLAVAAKSTAYCPYSQFRVGAALLTHSGDYVSGANVENASYPVGTCAERVALARAVTDRHRGFKALAVATDTSPPSSPCGMCRQFIREFCALDMPVLMFDGAGGYVVLKVEEVGGVLFLFNDTTLTLTLTHRFPPLPPEMYESLLLSHLPIHR